MSRALLECFGLCVMTSTVTDHTMRTQILQMQVMLAHIAALPHEHAERIAYERAAAQEEGVYRSQLIQAKDQIATVHVDAGLAAACVTVADTFHLDRYEGPRLLLAAARAAAAREAQTHAGRVHLQRVVPLLVQQRRAWEGSLSAVHWDRGDQEQLQAILGG